MKKKQQQQREKKRFLWADGLKENEMPIFY